MAKKQNNAKKAEQTAARYRKAQAQYQGTKQERAAHFAALYHATKAVKEAAAGAKGHSHSKVRALVEKAGGVYVLPKAQRAEYTEQVIKFELRSAAAYKGSATKHLAAAYKAAEKANDREEKKKAREEKEKAREAKKKAREAKKRAAEARRNTPEGKRRSEAARKGWETRRKKAEAKAAAEAAAAARAKRHADMIANEKAANAQYLNAGQGLVAAMRGALIQATNYRRVNIAVPEPTRDIMQVAKDKGAIPYDIRDLMGGQTKGGQYVKGMALDWSEEEIADYWTYERAEKVLEAIGKDREPLARAFIMAYSRGNSDIMTSQGRAALLAGAIARQNGTAGPASTVSVLELPDIINRASIKGMLAKYIAEVYYEDKQRDAQNTKRYKSMFGDRTIREAAEVGADAVMQLIDNGTKFMDYRDYINQAIKNGAQVDEKQARADKGQITKLIKGISLHGRDTITDEKNGEIFVKVLDILKKYGYSSF